MVLYILIGGATVIVVFLIVVAMLPNDFVVTRSTTIAAAPEAIFPLVNELRKWEGWSPWDKIDPGLERTYEGPAAGVGANYRWVGNNKVGKGAMTIMESRPSDLVRIRLEFLKPFKATNAVEFTFKPGGSQTTVTWSMTDKTAFVMKAFGLFMSMDKMVGREFDKGLAQMKALAEGAAKK